MDGRVFKRPWALRRVLGGFLYFSSSLRRIPFICSKMSYVILFHTDPLDLHFFSFLFK